MTLEFEIDGLEELEQDLKKAVNKAPVRAMETLRELAKDFKKSAERRADSELKPHERQGREEKKAIKRKWGYKIMSGDRMEALALIWNSARHFHLVENGHNLVRLGKIIGFVPGKYIMEKTRREYQEIVPERFEQMIDEVLKESDLS